MKVNLYYVVKEYKSGADSVGRNSDAVLISGPYSDRFDAQMFIEKMDNPYDYLIVVDEIKAKLA